jgi:sugar/nucleoside kinase (ribokinase family)
MQSMKKVLVLGGASYDAIVHLDSFPNPTPQTIHHCKFHEAVGSTGVGKAANLCKLGFDVDLQILTGNDHQGNIIREYVSKLPLNLLNEIDPNGTERHVNLMNAAGQRISIFLTSTSSNPPIHYESYLSYIQKADIVVLNIVDYCRNFIPLLKENNKEIWTDLHDYDGENAYHQDFIVASDFIFMSSDNLPDYQDCMMRLIENGKKLLVCTHGSKGASLLTAQKQWIHTPVMDGFERVDTNGAGDAFFAGFLYGYTRNLSLDICMKAGHIVAGACITSPELAFPGLSENFISNKLRQSGIFI